MIQIYGVSCILITKLKLYMTNLILKIVPLLPLLLNLIIWFVKHLKIKQNI